MVFKISLMPLHCNSWPEKVTYKGNKNNTQLVLMPSDYNQPCAHKCLAGKSHLATQSKISIQLALMPSYFNGYPEKVTYKVYKISISCVPSHCNSWPEKVTYKVYKMQHSMAFHCNSWPEKKLPTRFIAYAQLRLTLHVISMSF